MAEQIVRADLPQLTIPQPAQEKEGLLGKSVSTLKPLPLPFSLLQAQTALLKSFLYLASEFLCLLKRHSPNLSSNSKFAVGLALKKGNSIWP